MVKSEPKILILYARFGDGHYQVSRALQQRFLARGIHEVKMLDLFAEAHPVMDAVSRFVYSISSRYCPGIYGWSYDITNKQKPGYHFGNWIHTFGVHKLKEILQQEKPDAIIHTFPFLAMPHIRRTSEIRTSCFTVLTDYVLHNRWVHPETDRYFVASKELQETMIGKGVKKDRICVSGIPLRSAFLQSFDKREACGRYDLNADKSYILVMAGAYGIQSDFIRMIHVLLDDGGHEVILVCGKNQKLYAKMSKLFADNERVNIFGFVEHMEQMMALSSMTITKAGGITLTEAMALQVPVIVYRPLPGQEKGNADFLAGKGYLKIAHNLEQLKRAIGEFKESHNQPQNLAMPAAVYDAADLVVDEVLHHMMTQRASVDPECRNTMPRKAVFP